MGMGFQPAVLMVTDAVAIPASAVIWALQTFEDKVAGGQHLAVITQASQLVNNLKFGMSSLDAIISLGENIGFNSLPWLVDLARILKPGGVIVVQEPQTANSQSKVALERSMLLAGYIDVQASDVVGGLDSTADDNNSIIPCIVIKAQKPTWETGSSFAIKKRPPIPQESKLSLRINDGVLKLSSDEVHEIDMTGSSVLSNVCMTMEVPQFEADIDDFIDEDSLLTEDDLKRPELPIVDDCEAAKAGRKACKNCTCGRAEREEEMKGLLVEQLNNPRSACGNCGLGDAFRCSGCPYRGLRPFKLGEKITIPGNFLAADV